MNNPMNLDNKTILITGASSGIGRQTAITASQLGAKVILVARNTEALKTTMSLLTNHGHTWLNLDLDNTNGIKTVVERFKKDEVSLNGVVHAAAYASKCAFEDLSVLEAQKTMRINVHAFNELIKQLVNREVLDLKSSIVAISSTAAKHGDDKEMAYSMSKAALEAAVRYHAQALSHMQIRVNAIQPGWVKTPMLDGFLKTYGDTAYGRANLNKQPLGLIEPEEIAHLTCFLLSDATTSITASTYVIDGGFLMPQFKET